MDTCLIGDRLVPLEEASLPLTDLMFQRGLGAFESIYCPNGRPLALDAHLDRLASSLNELRLPAVSRADMKDALATGLARRNGDTLSRIYVTAGDGDGAPGRIFYFFMDAHPLSPDCWVDGVSLFTLPMERYWPVTKTTCYARPLAALRDHEQAFEGLYCPGGEITEAACSNFFLWLEGRLITAPLNRVLAGTTRQIVLTLADEAGLTIEERCPLVEELSRADEAFVTSTSRWLLPVVRVDDRTIGTERPGPKTAALRSAFENNIDRWLTTFD